jgi:hypothetical protein
MALLGCQTTNADIIDFNSWTIVEDPPHASFESSVDSSMQITLSALNGSIPTGVDIGYQSVDGVDPATSSSGHFFDPSSDFSIAVDFSMDFSNANGTLAFGFGVGENRNGDNSAGVTLLTNSGTPVAFAAAARINDVTQSPGVISAPAQNSARLLVRYTASSGDIELGVSTDGDDVAEGVHNFAGLQNSWTDGLLTTSCFIRSDNALGNPWQSGTSETIVTNFQVISGSAIAVVPEPHSGALILGVSALAVLRRKR